MFLLAFMNFLLEALNYESAALIEINDNNFQRSSCKKKGMFFCFLSVHSSIIVVFNENPKTMFLLIKFFQ